jgi:hypothetical protein
MRQRGGAYAYIVSEKGCGSADASLVLPDAPDVCASRVLHAAADARSAAAEV